MSVSSQQASSKPHARYRASAEAQGVSVSTRALCMPLLRALSMSSSTTIRPSRCRRCEAATDMRTTITMAELAAGPHATKDPAERARRQDRLQRAEAVFDPLPFDNSAARAYGRI